MGKCRLFYEINKKSLFFNVVNDMQVTCTYKKLKHICRHPTKLGLFTQFVGIVASVLLIIC